MRNFKDFIATKKKMRCEPKNMFDDCDVDVMGSFDKEGDVVFDKGGSYMKDNKTIAEFMGYSYDRCVASSDKSIPLKIQGEYLTPNGYSVSESELDFHTSWDWLMPVANEIIKSRDEQNTDWDLTDLKYALQTTNIEYVYKAVVEFINWYNKNENDYVGANMENLTKLILRLSDLDYEKCRIINPYSWRDLLEFIEELDKETMEEVISEIHFNAEELKN